MKYVSYLYCTSQHRKGVSTSNNPSLLVSPVLHGRVFLILPFRFNFVIHEEMHNVSIEYESMAVELVMGESLCNLESPIM